METTHVQPHERECALCTNEFTTLKILPCGHRLCRECAFILMSTKSESGCPQCGCQIVKTQGKSNPNSSETVDALPTDFVMEALVESARVLSKHQVCCVCDDVKADFICMQCQDMLCSACAKVHEKLSVSRSHDVESLSTVTPERLAASRPALCADHGDKQAEFFCSKHRLAICALCAFQKHKECVQFRNIYDEINLAKNALDDFAKMLLQAEQTLEQAIGQLTARLQEADVSEQEDMIEVDKTCDRLQKLVENFRNKQKELTKGSYHRFRRSLHDLKTSLSDEIVKVTSHKRIVTSAKAMAPCPALIHAAQALTDRVKNLDMSANLDAYPVGKTSSGTWCEEVVGRIEKELLLLEQKKPESKVLLAAGSTSFASETQMLSTPSPFGFLGGIAQHSSTPVGNRFPQSTAPNLGQHSDGGVNRSFNFDSSVGCRPQLNFIGAAPQGPITFLAEPPTLRHYTIKRAHRFIRR